MKKALFAYIPVVHTGVLALLDRNPNMPVWILDNEKGIEENVYLERDMRALPARLIKQELEVLGYDTVQVIAHNELRALTQTIDTLVIPNDEIVEFFIQKFAPETNIEYDTTFLRWTKQISTTEFEVPPDRIISNDVLHRLIIKELGIEAEKSSDWWRQIAALLVKEGETVISSHNTHFPTAHAVFINGDPRSNLDAGQGPGVYTSIHAEASVIARAAKAGIATEGCEIFVTTFPCPSCARAIVEAGIQKVYYAKGYSLLDAEEILKNAGVEIVLVSES